jgi:flagellar basal body P-ring protein FlgI
MGKLFKLVLMFVFILGCNNYRSNRLIIIDKEYNLVQVKDISYINEIDKKRPNFKNGEFNLYLYRKNLNNAAMIAHVINLLFSDNNLSKPTAKVINTKTIQIKIPLNYIEQERIFDFIADIQKMPLTDLELYITKIEKTKKEALLNKK